MAVRVTLRSDLLDAAGGVVVAAGTVGTVVEVRPPPQAAAARCQFVVAGNIVERWVPEVDLAFQDRGLGYVRAFLLGGAYTAVDVRHPQVVIDRDLVGSGEQLTPHPAVADLHLGGGITVRITAEANSGAVRMRLLTTPTEVLE
jgi:hypothetical protein